MTINAIWARTWDSHTVLLWGGLAGTINSDIPVEDSFEIGGLFNLSGYHRQELTGRYTGVARLIYYKEIGDRKSVLKVPVYIGGSLETGNAWNDKDEISSDSLITAGSLLITFDTPIGPLYLAKGFAEGGKSTYYLFLGRTFTFF
jgi:NTE family protein